MRTALSASPPSDDQNSQDFFMPGDYKKSCSPWEVFILGAEVSKG